MIYSDSSFSSCWFKLLLISWGWISSCITFLLDLFQKLFWNLIFYRLQASYWLQILRWLLNFFDVSMWINELPYFTSLPRGWIFHSKVRHLTIRILTESFLIILELSLLSLLSLRCSSLPVYRMTTHSIRNSRMPSPTY